MSTSKLNSIKEHKKLITYNKYSKAIKMTATKNQN